MNFFGIFTNKNDLAKVLTIGGISLFIFSLYYPLKMEQDTELKGVYFRNEVILFEKKIDSYKKEQVSLGKQLEKEIERENIDELLTRNKFIKNDVIQTNHELTVKKEELEVYEKYRKKYGVYQNILFTSGIVFSFLGLIGWIISAFSEFNREKKKPTS